MVLSTWPGEIDTITGLREILQQADVIVRESEPPAVAATGHIWHQMKALAVGLVPLLGWMVLAPILRKIPERLRTPLPTPAIPHIEVLDAKGETCGPAPGIPQFKPYFTVSDLGVAVFNCDSIFRVLNNAVFQG
jgi:hypothetical protein